MLCALYSIWGREVPRDLGTTTWVELSPSSLPAVGCVTQSTKEKDSFQVLLTICRSHSH